MIFHVCISSPRWPSGLRHPLFMQRVVGSIPAIVDAISFTFLPQSDVESCNLDSIGQEFKDGQYLKEN